MHIAETISSSKSGAKMAVTGHQHDHIQQVLGVEPAGRCGHLAGYIPPPHSCTGPTRTTLPATTPSTLPPDSAARSTTTDPGAICRIISVVTSSGAPSRHGCCRDQGISGGNATGEQFALPLGAILGHLPGVATCALERRQRQLDRLRAHRSNLFCGRRAYVIALDHRT